MTRTPTAYVCKNIDGDCDYATNKQSFPIRQGEDLICPYCKKRDIEGIFERPKPKDIKKYLLIGLGIMILGAIAYIFIPKLIPISSTTAHKSSIPDTASTRQDSLLSTRPPDELRDTVNSFNNFLYQYQTDTIFGDFAKVKAIIELGAERFDLYIIKRNRKGGWHKVKYLLGQKMSNILTGGVDYESIIKGITDYINAIHEQCKADNIQIRNNDIHFVVSSGALEDKQMQIIKAAIDSAGTYRVNVASPKVEAQSIYKCILSNPNTTIKELQKEAFIVDLGSKNAKIAWQESDGIFTDLTYGASYRNSNDYKENKITDSIVYNTVLQQLKKIPSKYCDKCIIIGGLPYELAKWNGINERYTLLKSPNTYPPFSMKPKESKDREKIIGGLNIYKAISDATGCKTFIFDRDSHFGIGYLIANCGY